AASARAGNILPRAAPRLKAMAALAGAAIPMRSGAGLRGFRLAAKPGKRLLQRDMTVEIIAPVPARSLQAVALQQALDSQQHASPLLACHAQRRSKVHAGSEEEGGRLTRLVALASSPRPEQGEIFPKSRHCKGLPLICCAFPTLRERWRTGTNA